jgi:hypothetical protein
MNSYFDLNRWLLYIGKHWNENKKRYLMSLGAIGGLLVLWYSFVIIVDKSNPLLMQMQAVTYFVGLFLTGCLFASLQFSDLGDGPKGISYLLLPVSLLEKLLTALLFSVILYFICYTAVYYIVDFIMVKVSNSLMLTRYEETKSGHYAPQEIVNVFVSPFSSVNLFFYMLLTYFSIQSIFMLGSVYFAKHSYIKTLVWGLIVFLVLVFWEHKIVESFMPHGSFFKPFVKYRVFENGKELMIRLPEWFSSILLFLMMYTLPPMLWIVTYFRLKEKEV